jgi:hypothetical protein
MFLKVNRSPTVASMSQIFKMQLISSHFWIFIFNIILQERKKRYFFFLVEFIEKNRRNLINLHFKNIKTQNIYNRIILQEFLESWLIRLIFQSSKILDICTFINHYVEVFSWNINVSIIIRKILWNQISKLLKWWITHK